jgi:6-phosphogluconolactonase
MNKTPTSTPTSNCVPATDFEASYVLTGYAVSMFTVNSCTGEFSATSPASVGTGYSYPQNDNSEEMVTDPLGRFAYVANLVSNASDLATISMYTIDPNSGVLTATSPATVGTGFFPQEIAIDPKGRFVYTANSDDSSVSMFTINQTTGVLMPTSPASVSTTVPGQLLAQPGFVTVDPTGRFAYVTESLSDGAAVLMFTINQTTGVLTSTSPATVYTGGIPFRVSVAPNGKFAYVVDNLADSSDSFGVFQYTVNQTTGTLTANNPEAVGAGNGPTDVVVDPTSKFAFAVNRQDNSVSMYMIDANTGNLTLNSTATNPTGTIATGTEPFRITFDTSGKFVYVTNEGSAVSIFTLNSDGTLKSAGTTGVNGLATAISPLSK